MKALGYIGANERGEQTTLQALDDKAHLKPPDNVNQLHVKVVRASDVHSRQTGECTAVSLLYRPKSTLW